MTKLTAADMMVIVDTLNHSLRIGNYGGGFTTETREQTMNTVIDIMSNMNADLKVEESEGEGE
jgi:hypothetical protein